MVEAQVGPTKAALLPLLEASCTRQRPRNLPALSQAMPSHHCGQYVGHQARPQKQPRRLGKHAAMSYL